MQHRRKERHEKIRDLFIFCCFSSLRWSDVCQLTRAHIDGDAIVLIQKKTAQTVRIELNKYTRTILEKYEDAHMPGELALPVMSNQKMNDALKILFKQAGLDKPLYERVTTHVGRKTFVVIGLSNDISPYTITQWTGHSSLAAMKPYMAIADKEKKNAMKKFDEV
ncbi:MAG: integrase catalytic domain-containing protein [Bacteroidales bacterium]|nr:integrase catalytic domain-containing protein [Bacteroidales bacterium]